MAAKATFANTLERIHHRTGRYPHECFRAFVRLAACAVSAGRREEEYLREAGQWKREDLADFSAAFHLMVDHMQTGEPFADTLGPIHMEWGSKSGKDAGGEFYTPWPIAEMVARMTFGQASVPEGRQWTIKEPACGSGVMVLALAKVFQENGISPRRMRVVMYDVSPIAVDMAFVQTTLWGIPALVVHGNTLSGEAWGKWPTLFWTTPRAWLEEETSDVTQERAAKQSPAPDLSANQSGTGPTIDIVVPSADERGQYSMDALLEAA